ncbi:RHS repeat-associated core domain-containing protein [Pseudomonas ogarae]|uniref:RHS repeat-associated core domain-containing protein n=1 Tax=Pseudomonas ogarae (strain DSM 112162 / CECT 30235 / F113) TaxID=1114970 RepID=UPI0039932806
MREHDLVQQCNPEPEGKVMNTVQLLCRYRYDPLDRLINILPATQDATARFYNRSRLTTEIQGQIKRSVFQHADLLLAQRQQQGQSSDTTLLVTDSQRSVLRAAAIGQCSSMAYSPYGHRPVETGQLSLLGFNGEQPDPLTGHYLLGNGYRAFNPVLMRFNSPDSLSPFGAGGVNAYAYALGDPVNRVDPTGHFGVFFGVLSSIAAAVAGAAASVKLIMSGYLYLGYGLAAGTAVGTGALVGTVAGSAPRQASKIKVKNVRTLFSRNRAVAIGERPSKKGLPSLVVHGHGNGEVVAGYTPQHLAEAIRRRFHNFDKRFGKVWLISCNGADNGFSSLGQRLADDLGIKVKTYEGLVATGGGGSPLAKIGAGSIQAARRPTEYLFEKSELPLRDEVFPYIPVTFYPRYIRRQ